MAVKSEAGRPYASLRPEFTRAAPRGDARRGDGGRWDRRGASRHPFGRAVSQLGPKTAWSQRPLGPANGLTSHGVPGGEGWLVQCQLPHHTKNNNVEVRGPAASPPTSSWRGRALLQESNSFVCDHLFLVGGYYEQLHAAFRRADHGGMRSVCVFI